MSRRIAEGIGRVYVSPKGGGLNMVAFDEGDEVPAWAAEQMGDHCFEGLGGDVTDVESEADQETPEADDAPADPATPENPDDQVDENDEDEAAASPAPDYESMTIPVLKAEIDKRNEGRDADDEIEVEGAGNKPDLIAALVADDAAQSDTDN